MAYVLSLDALLAILQAYEDNPVVQWKRTVRNDEIFVSVVTLGEVEAAVQDLPPERSAVRKDYQAKLDHHIPLMFGNRILPVDLRLAREWGRVRQRARALGSDLATEEAMEIATALVSGYTYVAKGKSYHAQLGVDVLDPYPA